MKRSYLLGALAGVLGAGALLVSQDAITGAGAQDTATPVFDHATVDLVAETATAVPVTCTGNRSAVAFQNQDAADIYYGDSTVTNSGATLGFKLEPGQLTNITVSCNPQTRTATVYAYSVAGCSACLTYAEVR